MIRIGISVILFWILFIRCGENENYPEGDSCLFVMCFHGPCFKPDVIYKRALLHFFDTCFSSYTITPILITIIAAAVLRQRITAAKIFGLSLATAAAIILISTRENTTAGDNVFLGDMLAIVSAIAYTFYFIAVKHLYIIFFD